MVQEFLVQEKTFILMMGMYGCKPCEILEKVIRDASPDDFSTDTVFYVKLRPSEFRNLRDREVVPSVPIIFTFKNGKQILRQTGIYPDDSIQELLAEPLASL